MRRYLVVANRTVGGMHLVYKVRECMTSGPCRFHIVVPASHPVGDLTWTEGQDRASAEVRLVEAMARLRESGAVVTGEVGDTSPMEAISDVLRREPFDEIIVSTLPPGFSRWLRQDLPTRVRKQFGLPVHHVVGVEERVSA
jgi:hypothetical protein